MSTPTSSFSRTATPESCDKARISTPSPKSNNSDSSRTHTPSPKPSISSEKVSKTSPTSFMPSDNPRSCTPSPTSYERVRLHSPGPKKEFEAQRRMGLNLAKSNAPSPVKRVQVRNIARFVNNIPLPTAVKPQPHSAVLGSPSKVKASTLDTSSKCFFSFEQNLTHRSSTEMGSIQKKLIEVENLLTLENSKLQTACFTHDFLVSQSKGICKSEKTDFTTSTEALLEQSNINTDIATQHSPASPAPDQSNSSEYKTIQEKIEIYRNLQFKLKHEILQLEEQKQQLEHKLSSFKIHDPLAEYKKSAGNQASATAQTKSPDLFQMKLMTLRDSKLNGQLPTPLKDSLNDSLNDSRLSKI